MTEKTAALYMRACIFARFVLYFLENTRGEKNRAEKI